MGRKELSTELKNFEQIRNYIEELLGHRSIDERTKVETLLVKLTRGSEQHERIGDIIFYVEKLFTDAIIRYTRLRYAIRDRQKAA